MVNVRWLITPANLKVDNLFNMPKAVTGVHWTLEAFKPKLDKSGKQIVDKKGNKIEIIWRMNGDVAFTPNASNFLPFAELNKVLVIDWVKNGLQDGEAAFYEALLLKKCKAFDESGSITPSFEADHSEMTWE